MAGREARRTPRPSASSEPHYEVPLPPRIFPRLRTLCLGYPEAVEVEQFGRPWFKAGKRPFCIYGADERLAINFAASPEDQAALCAMGPFRPTPYMHQHGWVTYDIADDAEPDWPLVEELLETAYRRVALQRMVRELEGREG